jgi:adenine phosphoribosyltransferase
MALDFRSQIMATNDWPRPGIVCYDIAPLLRDPLYFSEMIEQMVAPYAGSHIDMVIGIESRGFVLAGAMADHLGAGMAMIRKKGKLPPPTIAQEYSYEYAANVIEISTEAITPGQRIVIVDDAIATGGTISAAVKLVNRLGGTIVGISCVVLVDFMAARDRVKGETIHALVSYE